MLSPITLYVDDGAILTSGPMPDFTAFIITMAFKETHMWLTKRGLKTDQVKNELMHFSKSRIQNPNPSIHIPMNNSGELKEVTPASCMRHLGLWFDPKLNFHK